VLVSSRASKRYDVSDVTDVTSDTEGTIPRNSI